MLAYRIEFSFLQDGQRISDVDYFHATDAQDAVDQCRDDYFPLLDQDLRIDGIWSKGPEGWEYCTNWD